MKDSDETSKRLFKPQLSQSGVLEIDCEDLKPLFSQVRIIDVRRIEEFTGELGHIPGAKLVSLGEDLSRFLEMGDRSEEIVFVCRSGARSGAATEASQKLGYKACMNLRGGMLRWNELHYPISGPPDGASRAEPKSS